MRRRIGVYGTIFLAMTTSVTSVCLAGGKQNGGIGPIENVTDLQQTAKMLFKLADANNDGQISQKEAVDAGNLLVGGFFFRADANGDGVLTKEEATQARDALFAQQPLLKFVLERAKSPKAVQANTNQPRAPTTALRPRKTWRPTRLGRSAACSMRTAIRRSRPPSCGRLSRTECKRCSRSPTATRTVS